MRTCSFIFTVSLCISVMVQAQTVQPRDNPLLRPGLTDRTLSYVSEGFEGEGFPPPGWTLEYTGTSFWTLFNGASAYGVGSASAMFNIWDAPAGTTQSLVLSSMGASIAGDSIRFDHAYATYTGEDDRLIIETSVDGGTNYATLATLNGGTGGSLVTAPPTTTEFVPTAIQWAAKRYALPVGTNRVQFKAISALGNNIYIDNCRVGAQLVNDAGVESIDIPKSIVSLSRVPKVIVQNHGTAPATFAVTLLISPEGYSSTKTVTALAGNGKSTVLFDSWTPALGTHDLKAFTTLIGDMDPSNDTLRTTVLVNNAQQVVNISASPKAGQVFVMWDNLTTTNVVYTLYRSPSLIQYGFQLSSAQNLGYVRDNSALNKRLTQLYGMPKYLKIDSASLPLASNKGLFVATSTAPGSFYYAVSTSVGGVEDTTIVVGSNSLASPVSEDVVMPQPVWQQSGVIGGKPCDIYVQFTTKVTSPVYPQMTTAGSYPFHFALVKSGTQSPHPVTFFLHWWNGNFLPGASEFRTIGDPNEWVVTIDDWLPSSESNTLYYGYHENFDIQSDQNQVPTSGVLYNYTSARVAHTVNWVIRNLPVDSTRTYMTGFSGGASGTMLNALAFPTKIAAIFVYAPRIDMSTWGEYTLWGPPQLDLLTNEGYHKSERLNAAFLAGLHREDYLPIMYTFSGKNDVNVGWAEKPPFYDSLNAYRDGGFHFWGITDHGQTFYNSPWQPSFPDFSFFTRYRTNLSYPAFTNCSINNNPGNGTPSNGDQVGSINGHLDWNDDIVDSTKVWEITLKLKNLSTTLGADNAPDSATADITLRRLQSFAPQKGSLIFWQNRHGGIVVQNSSFIYEGGLVTIPSVRVYKDSNHLTVTWDSTLVAVQEEVPQEFVLAQNYPNPFNPSTTIKFELPQSAMVRLSVHDILGREVSVLVNERKNAGSYEVKFDAAGLASGAYFYRLQAGDFIQSRKLLLLR